MDDNNQDRTPKSNDAVSLESRSEDAVFLGWQKGFEGDLLPLYNVILADSPFYRSTVGDDALHKLHLRVPVTPSPYPGSIEVPWLDVGIDVEQCSTAKEVLEKAKLDSDEPIRKKDAFAFFDSLVEENDAAYVAAGVIGEGNDVWILARLPGYIRVHRNDLVNKYLLLTHGNGSSPGVEAKITPIRVVCNNTLSVLHGSGVIHIGQTRDFLESLEQARTLLGSSNTVFENVEGIFNHMAARKITGDELLAYVKALVPDNEEGDDSARTATIRDKVLELYDSGRGASLSRGTLWGAFNSVSEYTDHTMSEEGANQRLNSIWFGRGEQLKLKAFRLAEGMM